MKHTQGEWIVSKTINDYAIYSDKHPSDIALVYNNSRSIPDDEAEANAKLMSLAPELLETIQDCWNYLTMNSDMEREHKAQIRKLERMIYKVTEE